MVIYQRGELELKGNLHLHTTGSDGRKSPLEAAELYEAAGYDFLAITDHRRVTQAPEYRGSMALLPGIEMDVEPTDREVVHLIGVGMGAGFEAQFRPGLSAQEYIDLANKYGGACFLAHPHWSLMREGTILALRGLSGAEIFNTVSRSPYNPDRADSTHLLDLVACDGMLLPTVAADDTHFYGDEVARGFVFVQSESRDAGDIVNALKAGRFYASQGPRFLRVELDGDMVRVLCEPAHRVLFHTDLTWARGRVAQGEGVTEAVYRVDRARGESFVRVILEDGQGRRAWMRPFRV